ncbi:MAG: phage terminase large subunit family protein [Bacteroidota bacterium]|nr:phage terminase large subunit family protein [Bacteroidota bacterium]
MWGEATEIFDLALMPEQLMTVSEWADANRYLAREASSEPGRWRTSRTPYLKLPMDCLSSHTTYRKVIMMCGAQLGKTEAGNNWIGYIMDNSPAPTLMVMPTDTAIKKNSKTRIDPMIENTPSLKKKVKEKKSRSGENTIDQKNFLHGVLFMVGANSPVGLSSTPIRNVHLDEVDRYPLDVDGEGSPITLAEARTRTFPNRKILITSTPTTKESSAIWNEFKLTDQNHYEVPCPFCGAYQELLFENLVYEKNNPYSAKMKCVACGELIDERYKPQMLPSYRWIPACPENKSDKLIGFQISSLYSPLGWFSWGDIAAQYEESLEDPSRIKVFVNTVLGLPYEESGEAPDWQALFNKSRLENHNPNVVPWMVCFLTAGVDIQKDRIELEIVGWCADKQSYQIDYRVLLGNTTLPEVWDELAKVVDETFQREDGVEMTIQRMAVDTGYNTTEVHSFCRRFHNSRVIPIKGQDSLGLPVSPPRQIDYNKNGKKIGRLKQWNVGVSLLKSEFYSWLLLEQKPEGGYPPCYCHFLQQDQRYFEGITAEQYISKTRKWKKVYERNEPLDCRIYARAAANIVGLDRMKPEQLIRFGNVSGEAPNVKHTQQQPKSERKKRGGMDYGGIDYGKVEY